jgi:hypothetical protein
MRSVQAKLDMAGEVAALAAASEKSNAPALAAGAALSAQPPII